MMTVSNGVRATLILALFGTGTVAPAQTSADAGAYLAARAAGFDNDYGPASDWFLRALATDPTNVSLIENCLANLIGLGDFDRSIDVARSAHDQGITIGLTNMVLLQNAAATGDWSEVSRLIADGHAVTPIVDDLTAAWALLGAGDETGAMAAFDAMIEQPGRQGFGLYHKLMAMGVIGDYEGLMDIAEGGAQAGLPPMRRTIIAQAQALSQLGRNDDALAVLEAGFGRNTDPTIMTMRSALSDGETLAFSVVTSAEDGVAEAYFTVARVMLQNSNPSQVLFFARVAQSLNADDPEMVMLTAGLLNELERFELANEVFDTIPADDPTYASAQVGRAEALGRAGDFEGAVDVLSAMLATHPELAMAHSQLGDTLRSLDRIPEAEAAYTAAIDLVPQSDQRHWLLRFKRAIARDDQGDWPGAEADLRVALELTPDNPALLNYLGYSLVDRGQKLDEALEMIALAVEMEPENGAIVDSYGWALYRLGRYQQAVQYLERAVLLMPENDVINDHLGDAYWAVGRRLEARFQWERALSYNPEEALAAEIRAKLDAGLDLVMIDDSSATDTSGDAQDL